MIRQTGEGVPGPLYDQLLIPGTTLAVSQCLSAVLVVASLILLYLLPKYQNKKALEKLRADVLAETPKED